MAFKDWSATAASNVQSNTSIDWDEGMQAASVNNSARETMAQLAAWRTLISYGTVSGGTAGGSSNAFTLTCSPTVSAYATGQRYLFLANHSIAGSATLNVDGLGAKTLKYRNIALGSSDIVSGDLVLAAYDGADMEMLTLPRSLGNTQGFTVKDANFVLQDESDTTKQAKFQASGITTATTRTYALPDADTDLVGTGTTQTLSNKTLTAPVIATISNSGTLTLPSGSDTLVGRATTDTLTNKTLTAPVIATISNAGTLTLPTGGDTLVSRNSNDTLTNKTLTAPTLNGTPVLGSASSWRTALELVPGTNVQGYDAGLTAYAALSTAANKGLYFTDTDTPATFNLTAAGLALLDDADATAQHTTLGLGALATASTINNGNWSGTDLAVANGGTGASDAAGARTNLGIIAASASASGLVELATSAETQTGSDTTRAVTPAGLLSAFTTSFAANDMYFRIPGGAILQCGVRSSSATNYAVTFPLEFPNKCFAFVCTAKGDGTDTGSAGTTQSVKIVQPYGDPSTTGINVGIFGEEGDADTFQNNNSTTSFWWVAVGH